MKSYSKPWYVIWTNEKQNNCRYLFVVLNIAWLFISFIGDQKSDLVDIS